MITKEEAYEWIKLAAYYPITYMLETAGCYMSTTDRYITINKVSGKAAECPSYADFVILASEGKHVLLDRMFDDYLMFYKTHFSGTDLATLYAEASNRLFYYSEKKDLAMYTAKDDQLTFCHSWGIIEQLLYTDILTRINIEKIPCPPCVENSPDDPFYRVKPFMLKNGWTTNDINRTWVRMTPDD